MKKPKQPKAGASLKSWENYDKKMKEYNDAKKKIEAIKNKKR